jgi:antirestriction protein ArdC
MRTHRIGLRFPKQAAELGGQARKSEKGSLVVYADTITKKDIDDKGAEVETEIPFMKGYAVFNAEQIDGLPAHFYATVPPLNSDIERLERRQQRLLQPGPRRRADAGVANVS